MLGRAAAQGLGGELEGDALDVYVEGQYAYVVNNTHLFVFDVSDPTDIKLKGSYDTDSTPRTVAVQGGIAYLVKRTILDILDVSDPTDIRKIDWMRLPGTGRDIFLGENGLAYLAYYSYDEDKGMVIVNDEVVEIGL